MFALGSFVVAFSLKVKVSEIASAIYLDATRWIDNGLEEGCGLPRSRW